MFSRPTRCIVFAGVLLFSTLAGRPARADTVESFALGAGIVGAVGAIPLIVNTIIKLADGKPPKVLVYGGYVIGSLTAASGVALASVAHRIVQDDPNPPSGSYAILYGSAAGLVAIGLAGVGVAAISEQESVRRIAVMGVMDRDISGRLYAGAALRVVRW